MDEKKADHRQKRPLVVLAGPTAVGKTRLSIRLAKALDAEVISADSMQVYRHMDIGSAKIMPGEMEQIPHHLIDALEPEEPFHVVRFQQMAKQALDQIHVRGYGPTMLASDSKALAQFLKKGIAREDIVLKSLGGQYYSYTYVGDAVSAILHILLHGENGEAYNVADPASDITLKDLAGLIADCAGTKVVYELPDAVETAGYSKATRAVLDAAKLKKLGWIPRQTIQSGIRQTLSLLQD